MPQPNCAKRLECVELAPAFDPPHALRQRQQAGRTPNASRGSSSTLSFAACEQLRLLQCRERPALPTFPATFRLLFLCMGVEAGSLPVKAAQRRELIVKQDNRICGTQMHSRAERIKRSAHIPVRQPRNSAGGGADRNVCLAVCRCAARLEGELRLNRAQASTP